MRTFPLDLSTNVRECVHFFRWVGWTSRNAYISFGPLLEVKKNAYISRDGSIERQRMSSPRTYVATGVSPPGRTLFLYKTTYSQSLFEQINFVIFWNSEILKPFFLSWKFCSCMRSVFRTSKRYTSPIWECVHNTSDMTDWYNFPGMWKNLGAEGQTTRALTKIGSKSCEGDRGLW